MYNESLKIKFIRENVHSVNTAKQAQILFNVMAPFEEVWGADLCTVDADDLKVAVEKIAGVRAGAALSRVLMLKRYVKWCVLTGVPGAHNNVPEPSNLGLNRIRECMVASPLHLDKCLDKLFSDEECKRVDNVYRAWMWLAYCGVPQNYPDSILVSDVDLVGRYVNFGDGESAKLYDEAMPSITNCVQLQSFMYYHPNYTADISRDRIQGQSLLRGFRDEGSIELYMRAKFSHIQKIEKPPVQLTYGRIWLSGMFYRKKLFDDIGDEIDFLSEAEWHVDHTEYQWRGTPQEETMREKMLRRTARDYMTDYRRWKLVYYS